MKRLIFGFVGAALLTPAVGITQGAFISVPSGLYEGQAVEVLGGNFQPGVELHLDVIRKGGGHSVESVQTDAGGALRYEFVNLDAGEYQLRIFALSGAPLAETRLVVFQ